MALLAAEVTAEEPTLSGEALLVEALEAGDLEGAVARAEETLRKRAEDLADRPLELAETMDALGVHFYYFGSERALSIAASFFSRALELRRRHAGEDSLEVAASLGTLSSLEYERGRYVAAEAHERGNLRILEMQPSATSEVSTRLVDLGLILFKQGRYSEVEPLLERSRTMRKSAGKADPVALIELALVEGELHRVRNRFERAAAVLERALDRYGEAGIDDPFLETDLRNSLAGVYKDTGRYAEAEQLLRQVAQVWESDPYYARDLSTVHLNRAEVLRLQGRNDEAFPLYREALELAHSQMSEQDAELPIFINQLAVSYAESDRLEQAESLYREAIQLLEGATERNHPLLAQTAHDLGKLLVRLGDLAGSERELRRAHEIRQRVFGPDHPEVAASLAWLARTLQLAGGERRAEALALARSSLRGFADTVALPQDEIEAHAVESDLLYDAGDLPEAIASLGRALDLIESHRLEAGSELARADFMGRYVELYDRSVSRWVESGDLARAVETAERGRARVLLDQLASAHVDLEDGVEAAELAPLRERERALESAIAEHQARLAFARRGRRLDEAPTQDAIDDLERTLEAALEELQSVRLRRLRAHPLWREAITAGGTPISLETIGSDLSPGVPVLLYQIGSETSHLFVISAGEPSIRHWPLELSEEAARAIGLPAGALTRDALARLLDGHGSGASGLLPAIGRTRGLEPIRPSSDAETATVDSRLFELRRALVPDELWEELREAPEAVVIPHGPLHRLPFEALVTRRVTAGAAERYWIDDGPPLRYAASATSLHNLRRRSATARRRPAPTILIVADPAFERGETSKPGATEPGATPVAALRGAWGLGRLLGTGREGRAIRQAFEAATGSVVLLDREQAEEPRVRAELANRPDYLHFATHGIVDQQRHELLAALALTPPTEIARSTDDDGLLQLFEIYALDLDAELAVLSACESHVGRQVQGEGVFALSTGFLAAGARRVVVSHWPVDDESTAALMTEFYRRIGTALTDGEPVDYAKSLRDARLTVRKVPRWSSPFYWAPFFLIGP